MFCSLNANSKQGNAYNISCKKVSVNCKQLIVLKNDDLEFIIFHTSKSQICQPRIIWLTCYNPEEEDEDEEEEQEEEEEEES